MTNYLELLNSLEGLPEDSIARRTEYLLKGSPFTEWPVGMPASIDPKLIMIGVSPGNSPGSKSNKINYPIKKYVSAPSVYKENNSHFYWADSSNYWKKLRHLAHKYFMSYAANFDERMSISLTTHLNLGTGSSGRATKHNVEEHVVTWVSRLINREFTPDLVVLFGLVNILKDRNVSEWWNRGTIAPINWKKPCVQFKFEGYASKKYVFREWSLINARGHKFKLVIWPNHPSRVPFSNLDIWCKSVDEYMLHFHNLRH